MVHACPARGTNLSVEQTREATLGILTCLLLGATLGASILLGTLVLGLELIGDAIGAGFRERITSGEAYVLYQYAFFVAAPLVAVLVAGLLGMRAARTGHRIGGTAAATTLYGLPLLWVNLAVAMLLATALLDWIDVTDDRFDVTLKVVIEGIVFLVIETAVAAGFAGIFAGIVQDAFLVDRRDPPPAAHAVPVAPAAASSAAPEQPHPPQAGGSRTTLVDHPVDCPRCQTRFTVSGERPLRIQCPQCAKTGIIH